MREEICILRRALGPIVFADPAALARLNTIVWPEIARMAKEKAVGLWKVIFLQEQKKFHVTNL